jgi:hypothetical protein
VTEEDLETTEGEEVDLLTVFLGSLSSPSSFLARAHTHTM